MSIASKLQTIYTGIEDVRDALQDIDPSLGRGTIGTLGDDVRTLMSGGSGYGFKVYGDVRSEEEVEVEDPETGETTTETEYTYTNSLILDSILAAKGDDLNTDVIDGIGELDGDMVNLAGGKVQIPLKGGLKITVDPAKVYVKFRDPLVENIVMTNWGTDGKITLSAVRAITSLSTYFVGTAIETFNEFKWFDGLVYNPGTGANSGDEPYPFRNCTSLKEIKLPRVASLGNGAFCNCSSLTSIVIPDSFTDLGKGYSYSNPYFKNTKIEEIIIPSSVTTTSLDCFSGMPNLKRIVWGDNLPFPRTFTAGTYPYGFLTGCPNLEKIENITTVNSAGCNIRINECPKLDCSNFWQMACQNQKHFNCWSISHWFGNTKFFEASPNGVYTFSGLTADNTDNERPGYLWENATSEGGYVMEFPYWNVNPYVLRAGSRVGKIVFSEDVECVGGQFIYETYAPEVILPCTTPPSITGDDALSMPAVVRIYVPANSLSSYLADAKWSTISNKLRAYKDPSTAAATFCSIPSVAPIPSTYTKVDYISNIDGDTAKNCQISNLGYIWKQYSQIQLDFSHKFIANVSNSNYIFSSVRNHKDFEFTLSSVADDKNPIIYRYTSTNANYPNPMGLTLDQKWYYNSKITGESYGQRSTLKFNYHWTEYHGIAHQVDEVTGDAGVNMTLFRYNNNLGMTSRQVKVYRLCIWEPITGFTDVDDPTQYELVRDYVPVMRNSDGVFGLYERLTDNFYPSTATAFSGPAYE